MDRKQRIREFERELKAVDQRYNRQLFNFLGVMLIGFVIYKHSPVQHGLIDLAGILMVAGFLAYAIRAVVKGKQDVARKYGVVCSQCGNIPKALFLVHAMKSGKCPYCGGEISWERTRS